MSKLKQTAAVLLIFLNTIIPGLPLQAQTDRSARKENPRAESKTPLSKTPDVFADPKLAAKYQRTISPENLAARLYFLASDFFEGRETGARGQRLAARYLASQYQSMGLAPKGGGKAAGRFSPAGYLQAFSVYRETPEETRLEISADGKKVASSVFSAERSDDLSYFLSGSAKSETGGVVFAGYGIADDGLGYNDFAALAARNISIDGKWVLILGDEPLADASTSLLPTAGKKPSKWTQLAFKRGAAVKAGQPKGILVVADASPRFSGLFADKAAGASENARRIGQVSLYQDTGVVQAFAVSKKFADRLLASSGKTVEALQREIDQKLKPVVFDVKDAVIGSSVKPSKPVETENVIAFIEGSDPKLKDETVVISAHYDHLGLDPRLDGDRIFNGAADDGSGTAAALEIAAAFAAARRDGFGPRRSLLFVNFSAEEKGVLGSSFYTTKRPAVPLEKTVANINMDGLGGIDPEHPTGSRNYVYIASEKNLSDELLDINRRVLRITGSTLELTDGNGRGFSSDNQHFQNRFIPFIYYSTGRTEHYHQPSDEPETIDYEHLARAARLVFATVWQVANQDARISGVDRGRLKLTGYVCPPCPFECDAEVYESAGACPVCGMNLAPKYEIKDE